MVLNDVASKACFNFIILLLLDLVGGDSGVKQFDAYFQSS